MRVRTASKESQAPEALGWLEAARNIRMPKKQPGHAPCMGWPAPLPIEVPSPTSEDWRIHDDGSFHRGRARTRESQVRGGQLSCPAPAFVQGYQGKQKAVLAERQAIATVRLSRWVSPVPQG